MPVGLRRDWLLRQRREQLLVDLFAVFELQILHNLSSHRLGLLQLAQEGEHLLRVLLFVQVLVVRLQVDEDEVVAGQICDGEGLPFVQRAEHRQASSSLGQREDSAALGVEALQLGDSRRQGRLRRLGLLRLGVLHEEVANVVGLVLALGARPDATDELAKGLIALLQLLGVPSLVRHRPLQLLVIEDAVGDLLWLGGAVELLSELRGHVALDGVVASAVHAVVQQSVGLLVVAHLAQRPQVHLVVGPAAAQWRDVIEFIFAVELVAAELASPLLLLQDAIHDFPRRTQAAAGAEIVQGAHVDHRLGLAVIAELGATILLYVVFTATGRRPHGLVAEGVAELLELRGVVGHYPDADSDRLDAKSLDGLGVVHGLDDLRSVAQAGPKRNICLVE